MTPIKVRIAKAVLNLIELISYIILINYLDPPLSYAVAAIWIVELLRRDLPGN